jgi:hypothetical protein
MKNYFKTVGCVLIFALLNGTQQVLKRSHFNNSWEIGLGVGYTTYYMVT